MLSDLHKAKSQSWCLVLMVQVSSVSEILLFAGELILLLLYPSVVSSTSVSCLMLSGWVAMSSDFPLNPLPHSPQLPPWLSS